MGRNVSGGTKEENWKPYFISSSNFSLDLWTQLIVSL